MPQHAAERPSFSSLADISLRGIDYPQLRIGICIVFNLGVGAQRAHAGVHTSVDNF